MCLRIKVITALCIFFGFMSIDVGAEELKDIIQWEDCLEESGPGFSCSTIKLPLDNRHISPEHYFDFGPEGIDTVNIAMVRYRSPEQTDRKGTIFINPGGPGGSGVDAVAQAGPFLFTEEVRNHYDIIGFDPRGVGLSAPLICLNNFREYRPLRFQPVYPIDEVTLQERQASDQTYSMLCAERGSEILNNMTTADVARDMEFLRVAVGDANLNYAGYSYGSYLGVTYANMFPHRVGRMLVDGVVDPIEYATGRDNDGFITPALTRLESDIGAMDTLNEFFRLCDQNPDNCVFAGDSAERFSAILEHLKLNPEFKEIREGITTVTQGEPDFILKVFLFLTTSNFELLDDFLLSAEQSMMNSMVADSKTTFVVPDQREFTDQSTLISMPGLPPVPQFGQTFEGGIGVLCSDTDNPLDIEAWSIAGEIAEQNNGVFSKLRTWIGNNSMCASWIGSKNNRYIGPFNKRTRSPILIVSTLFDPNTAYQSAVALHELMPNSGLLTVDGWGHLTLFLSECADQQIEEYFLHGKLPEEGSICKQDVVPFGGTHSTDPQDISDLSENEIEAFTLESAPDANAVQRAELREKALNIIMNPINRQ